MISVRAAAALAPGGGRELAPPAARTFKVRDDHDVDAAATVRRGSVAVRGRWSGVFTNGGFPLRRYAPHAAAPHR